MRAGVLLLNTFFLIAQQYSWHSLLQLRFGDFIADKMQSVRTSWSTNVCVFVVFVSDQMLTLPLDVALLK